MRKKVATTILSLFIILPAFAQKVLELSNPTNLQRNDELVIIKRSDMKIALTAAKPYLSVIAGDKKLPVQYDDFNGDGIWDEAVLLYTFSPMEKLSLKISPSDKKLPADKVMAHIRHMRKNVDNSFGPNLNTDSIPTGQPNTDFSKEKLPPFLTEGPAWENDKVGFRLYFDVRNGKDIWGKTTSKMMMDTVGVDPSVIYHHKADWGMDIYKVGASLSAGALAINIKLKDGKDSLIRLGGRNMGKVIYHKIADGPYRAVFRLTYPEWKFASGYEPISITEQISIWGGQYFYKSDIMIEHAPDKSSLVTGFADLFNIPSGEIKGKNTNVVYAYGLQSENHDQLGLAIMATKSDFISFSKTATTDKDVKNSYLVSLKMPEKGKQTGFKFYSAWEPSNQQFKSRDSFVKYLNNQVLNNDQPIITKWI